MNQTRRELIAAIRASLDRLENTDTETETTMATKQQDYDIDYENAVVFVSQLAMDDYLVTVFPSPNEQPTHHRVEAVFINTTQVYLDPDDRLDIADVSVSVGEHAFEPGLFAWLYV